MKRILTITLLLVLSLSAFAQPRPLHLWKGIPTMKREHKTQLYVYRAPDSINTGVCVIVCPGGSYSHLMGIRTEGYGVAKWLNKQGINAFVLRYRVGMYGYHHPAMIQDVQRAIQYVRDHATEFHINPDKLGTMGFSAGGHLVTMSGAFYKENYLEPLGVKSTASLRPNFVVPVYPVVSMQDSIAHQRSRKNLLTEEYTKEQQDKFSMELQMRPDMPPTFLVTAKDDSVVMCQNSIDLDRALTAAGVPHVFMLYDTVGHGYGLDEKRAPEAARWRFKFVEWLRDIKILP